MADKIPEHLRPAPPNPASLEVPQDDYVSQNYSPGLARLSRRYPPEKLDTLIAEYGGKETGGAAKKQKPAEQPAEASLGAAADKIAEDKEARENFLEDEINLKAGQSAKVAGTNKNYYKDLQAKKWSELTTREQCELAVHAMLSSFKFDAAVGFVIFCNTVTIGAELEYECRGMQPPAFFPVLEYVFFVVYFTELGLRFFAHGLECLSTGWVKFDAVLVAQGILTNVVEPLVVAAVGVKVMDDLGPLNVFKVFRLLRLARAVRLFAQFRVLWVLVRGLLGAGPTICYTFILMTILLYLYACLAIELFTKSSVGQGNTVAGEVIRMRFGDLRRCFLTLIMALTIDSAGSIYQPIISELPFSGFFFFISYLLVVSVAVMNLVTAVIVSQSLELAEQDKEVNEAYAKQQLMRLMPGIRAAFIALDDDGSGEITLEEIMDAPEEVKEELAKCVPADDLRDLFELLDSDGGGSLDVEEFIEGLTKVVTSSSPMYLLHKKKQIQDARRDIKSLDSSADRITEQVKSLQTRWETGLDDVISVLSRPEPPPRSRRAGRGWRSPRIAGLVETDQSPDVSPERSSPTPWL
jgi:voltage-gated sodium channel